MEVLMDTVVAALASAFAALSSTIIAKVWERHARHTLTQRFTITTNSGNRIIVENAGELSEEQVRAIAADVASQSK